MSLERDVLDAYRNAEVVAREQLDRLLAPAGVSVVEVLPDGDGWRLRLVPVAAASTQQIPGSAAATRSGGMAVHSRSPSLTAGVAPLVRGAGESLFALAQRGAGRLRVDRDDGPGGVCAAALDDVERVRLLAGTLVGDTVLALRHLGEEEEAPGAAVELERQFHLLIAESRRLGLTEDPAPFAAALDRWTPGLSPGDLPWLRVAMEATHA